MPNVADGGSVTLTVDDRDLVSITINGGGEVRYENPPGTLVKLYYYDVVLGPFSAGTIKLTSSFGPFSYDFGTNPQPLGEEDARLLGWAYTQSFRLKSATRDANGAVTSATIEWPDGVRGTYVADTLSTSFPGATDAWHATYAGSTTRTVTQALITRNSDGAVTAQPAITIA